MSPVQEKITDTKTRRVERHVSNWLSAQGHENSVVEAYRLSPNGSIRLRIIHPHFTGKSLGERSHMTEGLLDGLPDEIDRDVSMVLLTSREEMNNDLMNAEFDNPSRSYL